MAIVNIYWFQTAELLIRAFGAGSWPRLSGVVFSIEERYSFPIVSMIVDGILLALN